MPERLPPGWWVKNSDGSFSGPPVRPDQDTDFSDVDGDDEEDEEDIEEGNGLDIRPDSPGWEDMEPDTENLSVQCLLCPDLATSATLMLEHCKTTHNFDFLAAIERQKLSYFSTIMYINYIRRNLLSGTPDPTIVHDTRIFDSEELLKPVLENDAFLFTLDEVVDPLEEGDDEMQEVVGAGLLEDGKAAGA